MEISNPCEALRIIYWQEQQTGCGPNLNRSGSQYSNQTMDQYWDEPQGSEHYKDPLFQKRVREGAILQLQRFKVAERFPASQEMAQVHYKANMFGIRRQDEDRVCPCCLQRIKEQRYSLFSTSMDNSFLSPDIVLLFAFIRMLIYYFLLRLVVTDAYNMYTSYIGRDCTPQIHCRASFTQRLTIVNKITHGEELFMVDLLNLTFVGLSIIYFALYDQYLYKWYIELSINIQTQDDYSIFVTNIPIIQEVTPQLEILYAKNIETYFSQLINDWLMRPYDNADIYQDYMTVAMNHGHHPQHPPKIVARVNICWDLYELSAIQRQKQHLQTEYQKFKADKENSKKEDVFYDDKQTMEDLLVLNRAGIELCQQFQLNHYYSFVVSKFLGKAFVSFEYEHFVRAALDRLPQAKRMQNHKLKAIYASPPRDVYWQNQSVTRWQRFQKLVITFFICAACLLITFAILLGIKYAQRRYYLSQVGMVFGHKIWVILFVSLFTIGINTLLRMAIRRLAKYEQHETKSNMDVAIMYKSIIAIICNQIINPVVVNLLLGNLLWRSHGIMSQITNLLTTSILLNILRSIINPRYIWKWLKFKWKYRSAPPILTFQDNYNAEYGPLPFQPYEKYMFYVNELFLITFYAYLVPFGSLIGVVFYMARYLIDKVMLLKMNSFHPSYTYHLTQRAMVLAQTSVFVFAIGNYINNWLYFGKWIQLVNFISMGIAGLYTILIWIEPLRNIFFPQHNYYERNSYSDCMHKSTFFHTYYSLNPATKLASQTRRNVKYVGVNAPLPMKDSGKHFDNPLLADGGYKRFQPFSPLPKI